jgi:pyruvate/2-oxoglutarate dehydrogenase complex dihydrolipoamide dehydrogenase (E3) component
VRVLLRCATIRLERSLSDAAIQRVGVIGAEQMGSGIAEVAVRRGVGVTVFETTEALLTVGRNRIVKSLERGVSAGKVTERATCRRTARQPRGTRRELRTRRPPLRRRSWLRSRLTPT